MAFDFGTLFGAIGSGGSILSSFASMFGGGVSKDWDKVRLQWAQYKAQRGITELERIERRRQIEEQIAFKRKYLKEEYDVTMQEIQLASRDVAGSENRAIIEAGNIRAKETRDAAIKVIAQQKAAYGAGGVSLQGSPMEVLRGTAIEAEEDAQNILRLAKMQAAPTTGGFEQMQLAALKAKRANLLYKQSLDEMDMIMEELARREAIEAISDKKSKQFMALQMGYESTENTLLEYLQSGTSALSKMGGLYSQLDKLGIFGSKAATSALSGLNATTTGSFGLTGAAGATAVVNSAEVAALVSAGISPELASQLVALSATTIGEFGMTGGGAATAGVAGMSIAWPLLGVAAAFIPAVLGSMEKSMLNPSQNKLLKTSWQDFEKAWREGDIEAIKAMTAGKVDPKKDIASDKRQALGMAGLMAVSEYLPQLKRYMDAEGNIDEEKFKDEQTYKDLMMFEEKFKLLFGEEANPWAAAKGGKNHPYWDYWFKPGWGYFNQDPTHYIDNPNYGA